MPPPPGPLVVHPQGLTKRYGSVEELSELDLDIRSGEVLGCLGPNGAGKTTLIRLLLGLIRPTAGSARVFGLDATREAATVHRRLAYVPGETSYWPSLTGRQTLHLLARLHGGDDAAYRAELIDRFDLDPSRRVRTYSKGNRQKLALVAALATRAELLVLDEPTSGLDPLMEQTFRECVRAAADRGQTVLLSSHILGEVEALCDRVAILRAGRLVDLGTLAQLRHLSALEVEVTFAGAPPDLTTVPGVADVRLVERTVTCHVRGSIDPLLGVLGHCHVTRLISREPSLEELFLAHYGASPSQPVPDVA
ncbi:MAG: ABC transporter ATP-binding protein [Actinobacteria bacterium]|nr:ABC transporter ATP-binding protein [Actinomycetota bacterium]